MSKLLSIIIPTRNSSKFLESCLNSLSQQSFKKFKIVFVDCGSTDDTLRIAATIPQGQILTQVGTGLASAWNQGILASRSKYVGFLDSDDFWEPNCLMSHMSNLIGSPEIDYSIGSVRYFAENKSELPYGFKPSLLEGTYRALMPGCFVGKRDLFERVGLFDETLTVATDIQWFHDLKLLNASFRDVDAVVLNKRVHAQNLSYSLSKTPIYNSELLGVIKRRLSRASNGA